MPDTQFYTAEAALAKATVTKTTLAASKLHLFKSDFTPNSFTTEEELRRERECDFDGYAQTRGTRSPHGKDRRVIRAGALS